MGCDLLSLSPTNMLIARMINYSDDQAVLAWARKSGQLDALAGDPDVEILLRTNDKQPSHLEKVQPTLEKIIEMHWPDFVLPNPEAENFARTVFEARLQDYLDDKCSPWDVCGMIDRLEQIFDYPAWLGRMYDACDWIEPTTVREGCPYLADEIRLHITKIQR